MSYFLFQKLERQPIQLLSNTGCTTNLLSMQMFDKLHKSAEALLEKVTVTVSWSLQPDWPLYEVVHLPI